MYNKPLSTLDNFREGFGGTDLAEGGTGGASSETGNGAGCRNKLLDCTHIHNEISLITLQNTMTTMGPKTRTNLFAAESLHHSVISQYIT